MNTNVRLASALLLFFALPLLAADTPDFRAWINSPEAYFATNAERDEWAAKVHSKEDADRFIEEYWRKRGEQFKKDVRTRIEKADQLFGLAGKPGALTSKGRVWIMLGSPNREQSTRGNMIEGTAAAPGTARDQFQNSPLERGLVVTHRWIYQKDRLPKELNVPELIVIFQTNAARGHQTIENPGLIEPYLKRVAEYYVSRPLAAAIAPAPAAPAEVTTGVQAEDPLWNAQDNPAGTFFASDAYIAPNEKPFYAVSYYLPQSATAFADVKSVLMVGLVKNEAGQQVAAVREQLPLKPYGSTTDRYVDRSFALAPGKYTGSFALFTPEGTTLLANRRIDFEVPAPTATTVSQLMPTAQIDDIQKQQPLDPFTFVAMKYAVKGDHRFTLKDKVAFFTVISNPAGDTNPQLMMGMKIFRDGKLLHRIPPSPASLTQTGPHTWLVGPAFDPGTFEAGQYAIEVQLKDLNAPKESDAFAKGYLTRTEFRIE